MYSLVIPVYRNEACVPALLDAVRDLDARLSGRLEAIFVVDGSPDRSHALLKAALASASVRSRLLLLSRNFGSFAAIRTGLAAGTGRYFAVMAADLQEPPELVLEFVRLLEAGDTDIVVGVREKRGDPWLARTASRAYWFGYRRLVQPEMPVGGVDVFGCTREVRDQLAELPESNSSLIGLLFWVGFRRRLVGYERRPRPAGTSGWRFSAKVRYALDSVFAFSDLPIRLLMWSGLLGLVVSTILGLIVLFAKVTGAIPIPGYAATALMVVFFGGLNSFGLGIVGSYVWRTFENTKIRPYAIVMSRVDFEPRRGEE